MYDCASSVEQESHFEAGPVLGLCQLRPAAPTLRAGRDDDDEAEGREAKAIPPSVSGDVNRGDAL